jgi:hypothetical protein
MCELTAALVGMVVMGILALTRGTIKLSFRRAVVGTPARIIGVLLILPLPMYFAFVVVAGVIMAELPQVPDRREPPIWLCAVGTALAALSVITAVVIGALTATPTAKRVEEFGGEHGNSDVN